MVKIRGIGLALVIGLVSCENETATTQRLPEVESESSTEYKIEVIDGCEYIIRDDYSGYVGWGYMAHKGNCKNPVHWHNTDRAVEMVESSKERLDSIQRAAEDLLERVNRELEK